MAVLALGLAFGVNILPPILCLGRVAGVFIPIDTLDAFGVVAVLFSTPLTLAPRVPSRADCSCFAVIPIYLLALLPAVILALEGVFVDVELPSSVRAGREGSGKGSVGGRREVDTVRDLPGVAVDGRIRSEAGVIRPLCRLDWDACDMCEATEAGREGWTVVVGAERREASIKTPHLGGQEKYSTLSISSPSDLYS